MSKQAGTAVVHRNGAGTGRLPDDPAAYIAAAEELTNFGDPERVADIFAEKAVFETVSDGAVRVYHGRDEITRGWVAIIRAFRPRGFRIRKNLLIAADDVIVEEWHGQWGNGTKVRGIEVWRFDDAGLISECRLYSYLNVNPESSWRARFRVFMSKPSAALAVLKHQRRELKRADSSNR